MPQRRPVEQTSDSRKFSPTHVVYGATAKKKIPVPCELIGQWAVHKAIEGRGYDVTHAPSGFRFPVRPLKLHVARQVQAELQPIEIFTGLLDPSFTSQLEKLRSIALRWQ